MPPTLALRRRALAAARPRRRPALRLLIAALVAVALVAGGWLWLRDASLFAVRDVTVVGASGPQAVRIRQALEKAARDMTTLHVRTGDLRRAVEAYPVVRDVDADPDFPHRLRITVHERVAVAAVTVAGQSVAVAADGGVLHDTPVEGLPAVTARARLADGRFDERTRRAIDVLAAAPHPIRARIRRLYVGPKGWTAPLTNGPVLELGPAQRLAAKWVAVATVLADPGAAGATYIDVRLPERPVAGGVLSPLSPSTSASG